LRAFVSEALADRSLQYVERSFRARRPGVPRPHTLVGRCPFGRRLDRPSWGLGAPLAHGRWSSAARNSAENDEGGELPEVYRHAFLFTHHRLLDRNSAPTLHVPSSSQSPLSHLTQLPHTVTSLSLFTQSPHSRHRPTSDTSSLSSVYPPCLLSACLPAH